jgi:hypothetical protein
MKCCPLKSPTYKYARIILKINRLKTNKPSFFKRLALEHLCTSILFSGQISRLELQNEHLLGFGRPTRAKRLTK